MQLYPTDGYGMVSDMILAKNKPIAHFMGLLIFFSIWCFLFISLKINARDVHVFRSRDLEIQYDISLDIIAKNLSTVFPDIKKSLETTFNWSFYRNPTIQLIKHRNEFLKMADNPLTIAFALPEKNTIVIDYSKTISGPFEIDAILKHELCHILLHQHIANNRLPRWLDEGLCQWVSESIDEILFTQKQTALNLAALSHRPIPLKTLQFRFPDEKRPRLLAYETSKNFSIYLLNRYGINRMLGTLGKLKNNDDINTAVLHTYSISLDNLEKQWHHTLRQKSTWLTFLAHHLYEILFVLMALLSCYAFIRSRIKKHHYDDEDEDNV